MPDKVSGLVFSDKMVDRRQKGFRLFWFAQASEFSLDHLILFFSYKVYFLEGRKNVEQDKLDILMNNIYSLSIF